MAQSRTMAPTRIFINFEEEVGQYPIVLDTIETHRTSQHRYVRFSVTEADAFSLQLARAARVIAGRTPVGSSDKPHIGRRVKHRRLKVEYGVVKEMLKAGPMRGIDILAKLKEHNLQHDRSVMYQTQSHLHLRSKHHAGRGMTEYWLPSHPPTVKV